MNLDGLLDLVNGEGTWCLRGGGAVAGRERLPLRNLDGGRRNSGLAIMEGGVALATLVPQLQNELGAVGMHALDDGL